MTNSYIVRSSAAVVRGHDYSMLCVFPGRP